jgi:hypothetical protein
MAGKTTPTSVVADAQGEDAAFMEDHMYRLDALKMLAQSGISKPSEQDIKAIAIKLKEKDQESQQAQQQAQLQAQAQQQAAVAQAAAARPNLVAAPPAGATMMAPGGPPAAPPPTGAPSALNLGQAMQLAAQQGGGPQ